KTGGTPETEELLGRVDTSRLEPERRHDLAAQMETLADLISSHEPSAAEGVRYEVEALGPGPTSTFLLVEDPRDPDHPVARALADLLRMLDVRPSVPTSVT
ncbi:MAG TPA: hypothetical protein VF768_10345, partial [Holophagaceae bacterium]